MKKRTVLRAALGAAVAVAGTLAVPSAAQAVYTCKENEVCVYSDYDLRGSVIVFRSGEINFTSDWHFYNGLAANDNASSIINRMNVEVYISSDFDNKGRSVDVHPHTQRNMKGDVFTYDLDNDTMSFIRVTNYHF